MKMTAQILLVFALAVSLALADPLYWACRVSPLNVVVELRAASDGGAVWDPGPGERVVLVKYRELDERRFGRLRRYDVPLWRIVSGDLSPRTTAEVVADVKALTGKDVAP